MEKRQYERTAANLHVAVRVTKPDQPLTAAEVVEGVLIDASFSGCQLAVPSLPTAIVEGLSRGELVLQVDTTDVSPPVSVRGKLRWHNEHPTGSRLGVEYVMEVPAQVQLVERLRKRQDYSGARFPTKRALAGLIVLALAVWWFARRAF